MNAIRFFPVVSTVALMAGLAACSVTAEPTEDVDNDEAAEVWNSANNPAYVDGTFVMDVAAIPLEGKTKGSLIPGDYWATAKDSINARWDGDNPSPAEKLEKALNKPGMALKLSETFGIRAQTWRKECETADQCSDLKDGSTCAIPRGETKGRCIPMWWGICHGWAPYAFSEPAPVKEVKVGDVTFYPGDLEGLMSLAYSKNLPTKFISQRCNKDFDREENRGSGRPEETECRDMNPGSMVVVLGNMLGIRGTSLVEDRTFDDEVWNQPIHSYKITNGVDGKLKEVTKAQALQILGEGMEYTELLARTKLKKNETKDGVYEATADGEIEIRTEGNGDADLYVNLNAAATASANVCRSTGGGSDELCKVTVKAGDKVHYQLLGYSEESEARVQVGLASQNTTYKYNQQAERFFDVEIDVNYITESRPQHYSHSTPDRLNDYVRTDRLHLILEARANGTIMGGEWVGASRRHHPDFMWWPSGKPQGSLVNGLTYADIKAIHDKAAEGGEQPGGGGQEETKQLFTSERVTGNSSKYATVGVQGGKTLKVTMTGEGQAELYVKLGRKPTIHSYDCKSTIGGTECSVKAPPAGGTYYVRVRPVSGGGTVNVTAKITN